MASKKRSLKLSSRRQLWWNL